jgi:hypothetical protein
VSLGLLRQAREWLLTVRAVGRLRSRARRPPRSPTGPGAPPRPMAPRPDDDPALRARLRGWSRRSGRPPGTGERAGLAPADAAEAERTLLALRAQMTGPAAQAIDEGLESGAIAARRLGPADGYVWELPGVRLFAIVGVQAFTVEDRR